jgi:hypothetical protein
LNFAATDTLLIHRQPGGTVIEASAMGTTVEFDGSTVTIRRISGIAVTIFDRTAVSIPIAQIGAIEWKAPSWKGAGHLRLVVAGSQASATPTAPNRDVNAVLFSRKQAAAFEKLRDTIQAAISR